MWNVADRITVCAILNFRKEHKMNTINFRKRLLSLFLQLITGILLLRIIFNIIWVPTSSMEPTIKKKSLHLSWALPFFFKRGKPERGDIVAFKQAEHKHLMLKRVIAVGGDVVEIKDRDVYVNGERLEESYLQSPHSTLSRSKLFVVPDQCFLALGDNRYGSADARVWKTTYTPYKNIRCKILF